jgi:Cys-Gly metallodipeptidase DUG1
MAHALDGYLKAAGVETRLVDLGDHLMAGEKVPLPPVILGKVGDDPTKKTVLVYGHFDVQPVSIFPDASFTVRFSLDLATPILNT